MRDFATKTHFINTAKARNARYFEIKTYRQTKLNSLETLFVPAFCVPFCKAKSSPFAINSKIERFRHLRPLNPYCFFKTYKRLKKYVILGFGANCGECLATFWKLLRKLKNKCEILAISSILKNPAFGYRAQADFYNAILWVKTRLGYVEFWSFCAYLERVFGRNRKRPFKNAPRTLDIDIIGFKDKRLNFKHFRIPHIAWSERESVKIPLLNVESYKVLQKRRKV